MATTTFPTDQQLPNTNKIIRQTDCQYSFGKEAISLTLKFMGDTKEAVGLAAAYRSGTRVKVSDLTGKFTELNGILPTTQLEATGRVTASVSSTKTGSGSVSITVQVPYKAKISIGGSGGSDDPAKRVIVTWSEKSTDHEFPLEIYAGEGQSASTRNAGEFEAWKNEKNKNIDNYKNFKYTGEDGEPVELGSKTKELAEKWYRGVESVRRAYPEVIRTTQYLNLKGDKDEVDNTLIDLLDPKTGGVKLYYRDQTPNAIWKNKFPKFDWLYASYDVNTEVTEYQKLWNATVTESWIGIDTNERGTWDDDLYGPDGTRWKFAGVTGPQSSGQKPQQRPNTRSLRGALLLRSDPPPSGQTEDFSVDTNPVIDLDTFSEYSDMLTLNLATSARLIHTSAFEGYTNLNTINLSNVSSLWDSCFKDCTALENIGLSSNITYMGTNVFDGCTALEKATIEPTIFDLPADSFANCTSLVSSQGEDGLVVGGYIKQLGERAFKDCTALTAINCTNALTSIGANAFENDEALTSFSMGLNSTGSITIGDEAFKGCEKLADIELPVPTITLGTDSFLNAFASEVTVQAPKSFLSNLPGTSSYNYIYPAFVTSIANDEFRSDTKLLSVVVPETITSMSDSAFRQCTNLTSAVLNNATIGDHAFTNCSSLTDVSMTAATSLGRWAFQGCTALTGIELPDTLTTIGQSAFIGCSSLQSIDLPETVTAIGNNAFQGCAALDSVILPENATGTLTLGDSVFNGCSALERVDLPVGTLTVGTTIFNNALANEIWLKAPFNSSLVSAIPSGKAVNFIYPSFTTSIAANEWKNNTNLKSITVPETVTSVGADAFRGCTGLVQADFSPGATTLSNGNTFNGDTALQVLTVGGSSLTNLPVNFAKNCTALVDLVVTAPLTTLDNGTTDGNNGVFFGCTALTNVELPDTLTTIGRYAFKNCSALVSLTIPSAVTTIGVGALNIGSSTNLPEVTMEGKTQATVQAMADYPWGLRTGSTVHCTDGDITIS